MSAALPGSVSEPQPHEPTVHEWLDHVLADLSAGRDCEAGDSLVATVCASAVDPLEIAASLEASGISKRVVAERYGYANVFALAEELWTKVAFRPGPGAPRNNLWRVGNVRDLGRGALYAAPALMLLALTRAANLQFSWWVLPLAITWGWALGQVTAYFGYTFKSRPNRRNEKLVLGWVMVATVISTADFASVAMILIGGDGASILGATGVTTYMVAERDPPPERAGWVGSQVVGAGWGCHHRRARTRPRRLPAVLRVALHRWLGTCNIGRRRPIHATDAAEIVDVRPRRHRHRLPSPDPRVDVWRRADARGDPGRAGLQEFWKSRAVRPAHTRHVGRHGMAAAQLSRRRRATPLETVVAGRIRSRVVGNVPAGTDVVRAVGRSWHPWWWESSCTSITPRRRTPC